MQIITLAKIDFLTQLFVEYFAKIVVLLVNDLILRLSDS